MATNETLPKAEAKVMIRTFGTQQWRPALEIDPITIPVEWYQPGTQIPAYTDVFDANVIKITQVVTDIEANDQGIEATLVWSDCGFEIKATCPLCDNVFPIGEGFVGDELNEGVNAVCCGCDPRDMQNID